ncbi:protein PET100 homolog, mitochondrial isoform X2 [Nomascus leucogenys]|uniref:protein PET100 homolog, mitochondrial isoform X2 n=1 Tax=Nomascus leucogenys TaxID=61853 RepID=UPI00122D9FE5|nr:protein PET100 homolog, mitochondrial isoform X2 [Nomascus leucogenys]
MGVKLEIFRVSGHRSGLGGLAGDLPGSEDEMIIYLTFPVAMFWVSNQAEWFEDHVIQRKLQEIEEFKERLRKRREEKLLRDAQQNS